MADDSSLLAKSLVDVAVRAAVATGAPRRTVAATAAAVASAVMAELRGSARACDGAAAPTTASRRRRMKRKHKAANAEAAAEASQPNDGVASTLDGATVDAALAQTPAPTASNRPAEPVEKDETMEPAHTATSAADIEVPSFPPADYALLGVLGLTPDTPRSGASSNPVPSTSDGVAAKRSGSKPTPPPPAPQRQRLDDRSTGGRRNDSTARPPGAKR